MVDLSRVRKAMRKHCRWQFSPAAELEDHWWQDWDAINRQQFAAHPGLSSDFARLLVKHFPQRDLLGANLQVNATTLIKTLLVKSGRASWQVYCPAQAVVAPLLYEHSVKGQAYPLLRLLEQLPGIGLKLDLLNQDPRLTMLAERASVFARTTSGWQTLSVREPAGFAAYWAARPKELTDNLRRRTRRAQADQMEFTLTVHSDPDAVATAVDRFGELESSGWKGREGTALHPDNVYGRFYRELLRTTAASGNGKVFEQHVGNRLTASRLMVFGGNVGIVLKTTYDEQFRKYSAGHVLLHDVLHHLMDENSSNAVEFYSHSSREQLLWATDITSMRNLSVYRTRGIALTSALRNRLTKHRRKSA